MNPYATKPTFCIPFVPQNPCKPLKGVQGEPKKQL